MSRLSHSDMDCNTCDTAPAVVINKPEVVEVALTISDKAKEMLDSAFGDDRSHALLVGVLFPNASSHLLDGIEIDYVDRLMGGGFKINNPNASSSCGCGESFA